jgi:hypothetical protein
VDRLCRAEPEGHVVRTRHSDPMLLSEFLLTRVVEVAVHGLDLADALSASRSPGRKPWTSAAPTSGGSRWVENVANANFFLPSGRLCIDLRVVSALPIGRQGRHGNGGDQSRGMLIVLVSR